MVPPRKLRLFLALALLCPAALAAVCTSFPQPSSAELSWTGGSGAFVVIENALCQQVQPWTPVASVPWITITGGGTGMMTVSYTVAPNLATAPRQGVITGL